MRAAVCLLALLIAAPALAADLTPAGLGLTLHAPDGWRVSEPEPYTVVLQPPAAEAPGIVSVSLQNRRRPEGAPAGQGPRRLADLYVAQLEEGAAEVSIARRAPFRWDVGDTILMGRQVVAEFTAEDMPLRQWAVFVPSPLGPAVHMWLYTAPAALFERWLPPAQSILDSMAPSEQPQKDRKR